MKFFKVYCLVALTHNNPFVPPVWLMPSRVFISMPAFTSFYFMLANCKATASLSTPENQNTPSWAIREIYLPSEFCRDFSKKPTDSASGCLYLLALRFLPIPLYDLCTISVLRINTMHLGGRVCNCSGVREKITFKAYNTVWARGSYL